MNCALYYYKRTQNGVYYCNHCYQFLCKKCFSHCKHLDSIQIFLSDVENLKNVTVYSRYK